MKTQTWIAVGVLISLVISLVIGILIMLLTPHQKHVRHHKAPGVPVSIAKATNLSHWMLTQRFTIVEQRKWQKAHNYTDPSFDNTSPYTVVAWARIKYVKPKQTGPSAVNLWRESFCLTLYPRHAKESIAYVNASYPGTQGYLFAEALGEVLVSCHSAEPWVAEVYTPSNPNQLPDEDPPLAVVSQEDKANFDYIMAKEDLEVMQQYQYTPPTEPMDMRRYALGGGDLGRIGVTPIEMQRGSDGKLHEVNPR